MFSSFLAHRNKFIYAIAIVVLFSGLLCLYTPSSEVLPATFKLSISCPDINSEEFTKVIADPMFKELSSIDMGQRTLAKYSADGRYLIFLTFTEGGDAYISKSKILAAIERVESCIPMEIIQRGYKLDLQELKPEECPATFKLSISFPGTSSEELEKVLDKPWQKMTSAMPVRSCFPIIKDNKYTLSITFFEDIDTDTAKSHLIKAIQSIEASLPEEIIQRGYKIDLLQLNNQERIDISKMAYPSITASAPKDAPVAAKPAAAKPAAVK